MKASFQYSVLYYQHSPLVQEKFVLGLLFFFPGEHEIKFIYPSSLKRLGGLLHEFEGAFIKKILYRLESKAVFLTKKWQDESLNFIKGFQDIINFEFIVPDSSALQFSNPKSGIIPDKKDSLINYYSSIYFKNYQIGESKDRVTEEKIITLFTKRIKSKFANFDKYFKSQLIVKGQFFDEKFDYGWQNGRFNLITSLSFDLGKTENIKKKSQQQVGMLTNLNKVIKEEDYNIHFLVARPSNKSLFEAYENALNILEAFQEEKIGRIVNLDNLDTYIDEVVDTAKEVN